MDTYIQITKRRYKKTPETKACSLIMEKKTKKTKKNQQRLITSHYESFKGTLSRKLASSRLKILILSGANIP